MSAVKLLIGRRFGRLLVQTRAVNDRRKKVQWVCRCDCGQTKVIGSNELIQGTTRSCGCLRRDITSERMTGSANGFKHGGNGTREYASYCKAKGRCSNPNATSYENYGGRGIRFMYESFEQFLADVGPRPPNTTLDRKENNGHYEVGNCTWATATHQGNNRRTCVYIAAFGRTQTATEWSRETGIRLSTLLGRLRAGWSPERSLSAAPQQQERRALPAGWSSGLAGFGA